MALQDSTGTTLQCLKEFSVNNGFRNVTKANAPRRNALCVFLNVGPQTGREWFDKLILPIGPNLIRLQIVLEIMGYTVTERLNAGKLGRRIADYLTFCETTHKELAAKTGVNEQTVLNWANNQTPTDGKMVLLEDILQAAESRIETGRQAWTEKLRSLDLVPAPTLKVALTAAKSRSDSEFVIRTLKVMESLLVDLRKLASAEHTVEDREMFMQSDITKRLTEAVDTVNLTYFMKDLRAGPVNP